jgi:hypothetical protein
MKKILLGFLFILLAIILYIVGSTTVETIIINNKIKEFINHSTIEYEDTQNKRVFHRVNLKNYHQEFTFDPTTQAPIRLSQPGDIMVNRVGVFEDTPSWINDTIAYFIGGHSALVGRNDHIYEAVGFGDIEVIDHMLYPNTGYPSIDDTGVYYGSNYWFDEHYTTEFFGLRMKNATLNDMNKALEVADGYIDRRALGEGGFNYLFIMNTATKLYCGDLVNRSWSGFEPEYNKKRFTLNKDRVASMQNDMLVSSDAYMYMYYKFDGQIHHYYYL